jgi:zinc protease
MVSGVEILAHKEAVGMKQKKIVIHVVMVMVILLSVSPACAEVARRTLSNGLTLLLSEGGGTSSAGICILVEGGSRYEPLEKRGTYTLLPPMLKRGTSLRTSDEIQRQFAVLGDSFDFSTTVECFRITATVPLSTLGEALDLLGDLIAHPCFPDEGLEKEKYIALQAVRSRQDSPLLRLIDLYNSVFYPDFFSPEKNRIDNIGKVEGKDVTRLYREFFVAERTVVSLAGSFDPSEVTEQAERSFGVLPPSPALIRKEAPVQRNLPLPSYREGKGGLTQAAVLIGTRLEGFERAQEPVLTVLSGLLRSSLGGILFEEIREKQGLVYDIGVYYSLRMKPFSFFVYGTSRKKNVKKLTSEIQRLLHSLRDTPPSEEAVRLSREYCKTSLAISYQEPVVQAEYHALQDMRGEKILSFAERLEAIDRVDAQDIEIFLKTYFPEKWTVLVVR